MRLAVLLVLCAPTFAQTRALTAADYARAEKFMAYNTNPLVFRAEARPNWLPDERFWYRVTTPTGAEFILVDPAKGTRTPAFDHARLAIALTAVANSKYDAGNLPFTQIDLVDDSVLFNAAGVRWRCDVKGTSCASAGAATQTAGGRGGRGGGRGGFGGRALEVASPDGKKAAFIRDFNLWVRDVATRQEKQLTTDGLKDYGYATDNAGWTSSDRPILKWSPDSKKVATYQQDQRKVGEMYLVSTTVGHPTLKQWKYPLPGDENVTMIERVVIDVDAAKVVRFQMPPDQHRSSLCDDISCRGDNWDDVQWSPDSASVAFVSTSRDHKQEWLRVADAGTGAIREVLNESVPTFYESGNGATNWKYLPKTNEVIWFSERDNWGHLYLYDLATGKLKNRITTGEGNVTQIVRLDEEARTIYFLGVGREKGRDPYFIHLYRVGFDGKGLALLTPEDATHEISWSPSGKYFVDSYSKPDAPPATVARDSTGKLVATLERADVSKLLAAGWKPPIPFTVKARDGQTDLYGLMFQPTNLDPNRKYPIVNRIYPGPQTGSVGSRSFTSARADCQALAELGFIVVEIDGMGTPWRSKKFHEAYYGDMGDNTLPDQIAGMKQLAQRYKYIDIDRAGIFGHSGGGYATASAMFRHPDFFKVGVSQAGNHDNRVYEDDWGEKWQGLLKKTADGTNYDSQANQNVAQNLKGKLLLAHGTMDNNVPPNNTLLVVDALIKANKDFDLILFPNRTHGFGAEPYMTRRRWDYFVKNLLGAEPPVGYELRNPPPPAFGQ
jgi:dipeptidyl aminopeptidase/acylaminoacyl peptidase